MSQLFASNFILGMLYWMVVCVAIQGSRMWDPYWSAHQAMERRLEASPIDTMHPNPTLPTSSEAQLLSTQS